MSSKRENIRQMRQARMAEIEKMAQVETPAEEVAMMAEQQLAHESNINQQAIIQNTADDITRQQTEDQTKAAVEFGKIKNNKEIKKDKEVKEIKEVKETKEADETKETEEIKEAEEPKEDKEVKEDKESKEIIDSVTEQKSNLAFDEKIMQQQQFKKLVNSIRESYKENKRISTTIGFTTENYNYFIIRAAELGIKQQIYLDILLLEEQKRPHENINPFLIHRPTGHTEHIKGILITESMQQFIKLMSARHGMTQTIYMNYIIQEERERELKYGKRIGLFM